MYPIRVVERVGNKDGRVVRRYFVQGKNGFGAWVDEYGLKPFVTVTDALEYMNYVRQNDGAELVIATAN